MAILSRDEFFERLNTIIGTDTSDGALSALEDFTDTYNDLEAKASGDGENWEDKYKELDDSWRKKYQKRFFSSRPNANTFEIRETEIEKEEHPEDITFDDIITEN